MNPTDGIDRLKVLGNERVPLSFDEMLNLVEVARHGSSKAIEARNVAILQVFFHCAVRVSELVRLDVSQVDFDNRAFLGLRVKGGKHLSVLFNDVVCEALEQYLAVRDEFGASVGEPALFLSSRCSRIAVRSVEELIARLGELAGISRRISPHVLRHASATEYDDLGTPLLVVRDHLGHSSVSTTQRYVHVQEKARRTAVDRLGAAWKSRARAKQRSTKKPLS